MVRSASGRSEQKERRLTMEYVKYDKEQKKRLRENLKKFTEEQGLEKKNWQTKSGGLIIQLFHGLMVRVYRANSESKLFAIFLR